VVLKIRQVATSPQLLINSTTKNLMVAPSSSTKLALVKNVLVLSVVAMAVAVVVAVTTATAVAHLVAATTAGNNPFGLTIKTGPSGSVFI
jgi:hypothetical protein